MPIVDFFRGRWHGLWDSEAQRSGLHRLHFRGEVQRLRSVESSLPTEWNESSGNDARLCLWVYMRCLPSCPGLCTVGGGPLVYKHRWVNTGPIIKQYWYFFALLPVYLCLTEYIYIHDDLGLFWITGRILQMYHRATPTAPVWMPSFTDNGLY